MVAATAALGLIAGPAFAGTDSGTVNCGSVSYEYVRGQQQTVSSTLYIYANGYLKATKSNLYWYTVGTTYMGTRSWQVTSYSLDWPGSYGYCVPAGG